MIPAYLLPLANHLWQSTLFVAAVGIVNLALRKNRAAVRHRLWFAASVKFLIPFSLLVGIGSHFQWRTAPATAPRPISIFMDEIGQPFTPTDLPVAAMSTKLAQPNSILAILLCVWICGFAASIFWWFIQWRRLHRALRQATHLDLDVPLRVVCCPERIEPGVLGIVTPVLLLPEGITDRLSPAELQAVLAHELCHVRRRDNLTAAVHMVVEALFWFHPLVWWIQVRLIEEQERACDEAVLQLGGDPQVYAESILKICEFYVTSPLLCASGITGSDLKNRIATIMTNRISLKLNVTKKLLLAIAGLLAIVGPIVAGFKYAPELTAQDQASEHLAFEVASVKLNKSEPAFSGAARAAKEAMLQRMTLQYLPGGRFSARGVPILFLIFEAYNVSPGRIVLNPEFEKSMDRTGESDRYDIEAVAEQGAIPANASPEVRKQKIRLMLQSLLADRFKVRISHETKEVPVYAIVVGKDGPKLQKSAMAEAQCAARSDDKPQIARIAGAADPASCHAFVGDQGRGLRGQAVDMSDLAQAFNVFSDRPVVNQTGLNGLFKIDVRGWAPLGAAPRPPGTEPTAEERAYADPARPTISDILQNLGLRLVSTKAAVEMYVVEHFEKPAQN